ncbi:MAG: RNA polymerase sigma factor [Planctomycetota bacterium]|jgi:RNA polymerase sigma-70 factor (ECF subfamily)|nr:RNA polymerase sigma factor [Planctomycetota bacterium]
MQDSGAEDLADIKTILAGDVEAFERIVERHGVAIQRQMRNFTRDIPQVEELTQEVFVEAFLNLGKFRGEAPFRNWLAKIATLLGYKFWRNRERSGKLVSLSATAEPVAGDGKKSENPGDPAAAAALLHELLATLPDDDRMAMVLMYLEKLDQEEIAERMGWTRVKVAVRLYRAKRRLRKLGGREPWKGRLEWMLS